MIYVIANTIKEGKNLFYHFCLANLMGVKFLSTNNSIAGRKYDDDDIVYVFTDNSLLWQYLIPNLDGARVVYHTLATKNKG